MFFPTINTGVRPVRFGQDKQKTTGNQQPPKNQIQDSAKPRTAKLSITMERGPMTEREKAEFLRELAIIMGISEHEMENATFINTKGNQNSTSEKNKR